MYTEAPNNFITFDEKETPYIRGTKIKVLDIIISKMVHGNDMDELQYQYPQLAKLQIESAIDYFNDHKELFNRTIKSMMSYVKLLQTTMKIDPFVNDLSTGKN